MFVWDRNSNELQINIWESYRLFLTGCNALEPGSYSLRFAWSHFRQLANTVTLLGAGLGWSRLTFQNILSVRHALCREKERAPAHATLKLRRHILQIDNAVLKYCVSAYAEWRSKEQIMQKKNIWYQCNDAAPVYSLQWAKWLMK